MRHFATPRRPARSTSKTSGAARIARLGSLLATLCVIACAEPTPHAPAAPTGASSPGQPGQPGAGAQSGAETSAATAPGATGWLPKPPATTDAPSAATAGAAPSLTTTRGLRVITWNIHHGEGLDKRIDLDRIAAWLRSMQPDVVFLQEVDRLTARSGNVDQATVLGQQLGMWSAFGAFMPFDGGEYGMAILSRYELGEVRNIALPPGRQEPRTSLAATIRPFDGPRIRLFNVHLDWLENDTDRYAQAQALLREISADVAAMGNTPAIIAGDFNDRPGSRTIALVKGQLGEAAKTGTPQTYPSDNPSQEIDFVFVLPANHLTAQPAIALDANGASDHRPVLTTVLMW
ncbi:MAG: endonuclease/exonuclease/phosphatase family protein [Phycisphaerales bacterium]|jgi:endonuclease/exonuclease/phosphatase family metal-dependent hydrolase